MGGYCGYLATAGALAGGADKASSKAGRKQSASSRAIKETEVDQVLVLYEFIALLVRISFWRANPYHGIIKLAVTLVPFPDCLSKMLHEVVPP